MLALTWIAVIAGLSAVAHGSAQQDGGVAQEMRSHHYSFVVGPTLLLQE